MRKIIALALAAVMSVSLLCLPAAAKATGVRDFTDVSADFWARAKIDEVVKEGWFNGTTSTTFAPNEYMTRGQFVAVLARFDGVKLTDSNTKFSDVPSTKYYAPAVKWAEANGIVTGYSDGTFRPNAPITRQQIAAFVQRYFQSYKGANLKKALPERAQFTDYNDAAAYGKNAMDYCRVYGLIYGYSDGTYRPLNNVTRAQVAAILTRIVTVVSGGGSSGGSSEPKIDPNDYIALATQDAVSFYNARVSKANAAGGEAEALLGASASIGNAKFTKTGDKGERTVTITGEATLNPDILNKALASAVYLAYTTVLETTDTSKTTNTDMVVTLSEIKEVVKKVADDLGINYTGVTVQEAAKQVKAALDGDTSGSLLDTPKAVAHSFWANFRNYPSSAPAEYPFGTMKVTIEGNDIFTATTSTSGTNVTYGGGSKKQAIINTAKGLMAQAKTSLQSYTSATSEVVLKGDIKAEFDSVKPECDPFTKEYHIKAELTLSSDLFTYQYKSGTSILTLNVNQAFQTNVKDELELLVSEIGEDVSKEIEEQIEAAVKEKIDTTDPDAIELASKYLVWKVREAVGLSKTTDLAPENIPDVIKALKAGIDINLGTSYTIQKNIDLSDVAGLDAQLTTYIYACVADSLNKLDGGVATTTQDDALPGVWAGLKDSTAGGLAKLLKSDKVLELVGLDAGSTKGFSYVKKLQKAINDYLPDGASVEVAGTSFTKSDLSDLLSAANVGQALKGVAKVLDKVSALAVSDFEGDGVAVKVSSGSVSASFNFAVDFE